MLPLNYEQLPPSAADVASDLKMGIKAVQQTFDKPRAAEAAMGQKENDGILMDSDIEIDEHSLRKFCVSHNSMHFAEAIRASPVRTPVPNSVATEVPPQPVPKAT